MLFPPVSFQGFAQGGFIGANPPMPELGQFGGVALSARIASTIAVPVTPVMSSMTCCT